ncbi:Txe/YoeB family addiction module toxin [Botryobacter ruber]|uniref:Txe/YoeB family addiction module toxin n=1 Tax=Botryobacter ruber TaxID=2171629 RepID=UPI000E0AFC50|nr:Txe/YoeB family addiction module toxin [Botryobacter ruber]
MEIKFTSHAWDDFIYLIENEPDAADKVLQLLRAIKTDPFKGLGKPEPLKHDLKGFWSRRITGEHRLVYRICGTRGVDQICSIIQCRFHYDD